MLHCIHLLSRINIVARQYSKNEFHVCIITTYIVKYIEITHTTFSAKTYFFDTFLQNENFIYYTEKVKHTYLLFYPCNNDENIAFVILHSIMYHMLACQTSFEYNI